MFVSKMAWQTGGQCHTPYHVPMTRCVNAMTQGDQMPYLYINLWFFCFALSSKR